VEGLNTGQKLSSCTCRTNLTTGSLGCVTGPSPGSAMSNYGGDHGPPRERRGFRGTAENAKTVMCTRFTSPEGCRFGDRCNFAHADLELKPRRSRYGGQVCVPPPP
jgi:hypothetical protein